MKIEVQFEGLIANIVGKKRAGVDLPEGASTRDLITRLAREFDRSLESVLLTPKGELRPMALVRINGNDVTQCCGLDAPFGDQAQVTISMAIRPITGGSAGSGWPVAPATTSAHSHD